MEQNRNIEYYLEYSPEGLGGPKFKIGEDIQLVDPNPDGDGGITYHIESLSGKAKNYFNGMDKRSRG